MPTSLGFRDLKVYQLAYQLAWWNDSQARTILGIGLLPSASCRVPLS